MSLNARVALAGSALLVPSPFWLPITGFGYAYRRALAVTLVTVVAILGFACVLERISGGAFVKRIGNSSGVSPASRAESPWCQGDWGSASPSAEVVNPRVQ